MKTSEQMTADVLKRRDEELKALPKKRRIKMAAVGVPCAAAVAVTAFGVHSAVNNTDLFTRNLMGGIFGPGAAEIGKPGYATSYPQDYVTSYNNTELGNEDNIRYRLEYIYKIIAIKDVSDIIALEKPLNKCDPDDFIPQTIEQLNSHYGIEFDRFTRLHPGWTETHEPFGLYIHDDNNGSTASRAFMSDRNILNYVTEEGVEISVTAQQYYKFFDKDKETPGDGLAGTVPKLDPPEYPDYNPDGKPVQNQPDNETHNIYDDDGNIIGAFTPGYTPDNTKVTDDEYEAHEHVVTTIVYSGFNGTEWLTYLDMGNTWVRIHIKGILSSSDVIDLLEEYTADLAEVSDEIANEPDIASTSNTEDITLGNPNSGKHVYKSITLADVKSVEDKEIPIPKLDPNDFVPQTPEELRSYYGIEFDRLSRLHTDWTESHEPFGLYFRDESSSRAIINTRNTLNYTTPGGAKISVTAKQGRFIPIVTAGEIGAQRPSIGGGYIVDADGNVVEEVSAYVPENSNTTSGNDNDIPVIVINNYENTEFLVYIDMGITWVKIHAEGLSKSEFSEILSEYTK